MMFTFKESRSTENNTIKTFKENIASSADGRIKAYPTKTSHLEGQNKNSSSGSTQHVMSPHQISSTSDGMLSDMSEDQPLSMQNVKPKISGYALTPIALQADYENGGESATTGAVQIALDKMETVNIIAKFGIEPMEMLHLVDRWLQQLLEEFKQQRDYFKHRLIEKWQNQELDNIQYDDTDRTRRIYAAYKELEEAHNVKLSRESFQAWNNYLKADNDDEADELKKKFNALAEDYLKILHCLDFLHRETKMKVSNADSYMNEIKRNLLKLKELNNKQSHTICIVGLEKAGKSTFINALIGYQLLPTAAERCTQVRTVLKPPLADSDRSILATVKFYADEEFTVFYNQMVMKTDENQQHLDERKRQVMSVRESLKRKFPEEHFRVNDSSDAEQERTSIFRQLNEYITGEIYVNIIKEISIYTDKLPGKNYELLDVPGFDSPIKEHRDAGLEAIKTADAFLFLTNGQQPNLTQPQIHLLREIQQNHFEAMQRAFGIITKLDLCQTPAIYRDHCTKAYQELIEKKFKRDHIFVACPRVHIIQKNSEEHQVITNKLHSFSDDIVEGFERSKEALNKFIEYELPKTHLKQLLELGRLYLIQAVSERMNQVKQQELLPKNLGDSPIEEYIQQKKLENWDRAFNDKIFKPAFNNLNFWHTTVITKERANFIDTTSQTFYHKLTERSRQFLQSTEDIERQMFEKYDYSKIQLNSHPIENEIRHELCFELERIVDDTSEALASHLYHQYVCKFDSIVNGVCPYLKDLFHHKVTLEKCVNETHALVLRTCRPLITAALRFSHSDSVVKMHAINDLIYIAPITVYNIVAASDKNEDDGRFPEYINRSLQHLANNNDKTTGLIRMLFHK